MGPEAPADPWDAKSPSREGVAAKVGAQRGTQRYGYPDEGEIENPIRFISKVYKGR